MPASSPRILELAFAASALAFIALLPLAPYPGDVALKVVPILCLLAAVLRAGRSGRQLRIAAALVFCGIGDATLELGLFTTGLAAFLVGHLFYLSVFCRRPKLDPPRLVALAVLAVYGAALVLQLQPHLGEMALPVYLYMLVIMCMAAAAIAGRGNHLLVALGAVLFVLSDSLIAWNRFAEPIPGVRYWIMALYYGAQYLLTVDARRAAYR